MTRPGRQIGGILILALVAAGTLKSSARAQTAIKLGVSSVAVDSFPTVTVYLTFADPEGRAIPDLPLGAVTIREDGSARPDPSVTKTEVGSRQIFAILTGRGLRIRDSQGRSRFDLVRQALLDWWAMPEFAGYGADELTLITSEGPLAVHAPIATLRSALGTHQPAFVETASGYDLIMLALDYVSGAPPRGGMPGSLVLITPPIEGLADGLLENAVSRAQQTATAVFPVLIGPPESVESPETDQLRRLADSTGGTFHVFDPAQGLSSVAAKLIDRRTVYALTYTSQVNSSGTHRIEIQVEPEGSPVVTLETSYQVEVFPPEVSFVQPPARVIREGEDPSVSLEELPPTEQLLTVLIDFPDNHPRPITHSTLIVDDQPVAERGTAPFDRFTLDLTGFIESGSHSLRVEVQDGLGLQASSDPVQMEIEIRPPPRGLSALRPALGPIAAGLAVLVAGVVLALSLMSAGRRQATSRPAGRRGIGLRTTMRRATLQGPPAEGAVEAMLVPIDARGQEGSPLPLTGVDVFLGRDASLVGIVLDDPSVEGMHARMIRLAGGGYLLRDQGSVSGTWINFDPVPADGAQLAHDDLIHLGRVGLRFRLASPPAPREIRIHLLSGDESAQEAEA